MLKDPACIIFLGLSGAMIPGGMRNVIRDMIEMKLVDVMVSNRCQHLSRSLRELWIQTLCGVGGKATMMPCGNHRIVRVYDALMG